MDAVSLTHEHVTITKNGAPAAVLIGADEWESLKETLFWLSQPGVLDDIAQARVKLATGDTSSEDLVSAIIEFASATLHADRAMSENRSGANSKVCGAPGAAHTGSSTKSSMTG